MSNHPGFEGVVVQALDDEVLDRLTDQRWPPAPDLARLVDRSDYLGGVRNELASAVMDPKNVARLSERSGEALLSIIRPLEWDSEQLLMSCARLEVFVPSDWDEPEAIDGFVQGTILDARRNGFGYLAVRIASTDTHLMRSLQTHGFFVADCLLVFGAQPENQRFDSIARHSLRAAREQDVDRVRALARGAFRYNRLHSDPQVPRHLADGFYEAWAENSCRGKISDIVLLAEGDGRILGFLALTRADEATISGNRTLGSLDLMAVADNARGRGVAGSMLRGAAEWFMEHGVGLVHVGTQSTNVAAVRLYEKCGFQLSSSHYTLVRRF